MKIRKAVVEDAYRVKEMATDFWAHTRYREEPDEASLQTMFHHLKDHGILLVLDVDGVARGFVGAVFAPLLADMKVMMATEVAYWVDPQFRGRGRALLFALEAAAREAGVKYLHMVSLEGSRPDVAESIYRDAGYKKTETVFVKEII